MKKILNPLIFLLLSCFVSFCAFVYMLIVLLKSLIWGDPVGGYPSQMTVILFLGRNNPVFSGHYRRISRRYLYRNKKTPRLFCK